MYRFCCYQCDSSTNWQGRIILGTWDEKGNPIEKYFTHKSHLYIKDEAGKLSKTPFETLTGKPLVRIDFESSFKRKKWITEHPSEKIYDSLAPTTEFLHEEFSYDREKQEFSKFPLKCFAWDIETTVGEAFPEPEHARETITVISIGDIVSGHMYTWIVLMDPWKKSLTKEDFNNTEKQTYFIFNTEKEMIYHFLSWFEKNRPDIIIGWNSEGFDMPYVYNRFKRVLPKADHFKIDKAFSPVGRVSAREVTMVSNQPVKPHITYEADGCFFCDYMLLYKNKFALPGYPIDNYKLDTVCQEELGVGKLHYEGSFKEFYLSDFKRFVQYNIIDVQRLIDLEQKRKLLKLTRLMCNDSLVPYDRIFNVTPLVQGALILLARERGQLLITDDRIPTDQKQKEFTGAFVKEPIPGKYKTIASFDLNSLYPNIINSINISPETKVGKILSQYGDKITILLNGKEKETTMTRLKEKLGNKINISGAGVFFLKPEIKEGICGAYEKKYYYGRKNVKKEMLKCKDLANHILTQIKKEDPAFNEKAPVIAAPAKELKRQWIEVNDKAEFLDCKQWAQKINMNSLYGLLSNKYSIICDMDCAESVTLSGQKVIKGVMKYISDFFNQKYKTTYDYSISGDTDSCESSSIININNTKITIEELFNKGIQNSILGRELSFVNATTPVFDPKQNKNINKPIKYIYRHKCDKRMFKITTEDGHQITVTEDHSCMVEREGKLIPIKAKDILPTDIFIILTVQRVKVKSIEDLGVIKDQYVYDIGIGDDTPYFYANDILVHNSFFLSLDNYIKEHFNGVLPKWTEENIEKACSLIDSELLNIVNKHCQDIVKKDFWSDICTVEFKREKLCSDAMFIAKKNYSFRVINNEGISEIKWIHKGHCLKKGIAPKYIKKYWKTLIEEASINNWSGAKFTKFIQDWWDEFKTLNPEIWAINTGYSTERKFSTAFNPKGVSANGARCANYYNDLIKYLKLEDKYELISAGTKFREVKIKDYANKWAIGAIGFPDVWPKEFNDVLEIDYINSFKTYCLKPIEKFIDILHWPEPNFLNPAIIDIMEL